MNGSLDDLWFPTLSPGKRRKDGARGVVGSLKFLTCPPTIDAVPETLANPETQDSAAPPACAANRPFDAPLALRLWHLTSLDAPTVAVVWALGFAWAAGVRLPPWVLGLLALAVWAVYIGDRLLDARKGLRTGRLDDLRERHLFHWKWRRILAPIAIAAAGAAACIAFLEVPPTAFERDSLVAAAAVVYLRRVHFRRENSQKAHGVLSRALTKELLVGVLFAAGCALPAWNRAAGGPGVLLLPMAFFAALAWLNCFAIDRWEGPCGDSIAMRIQLPAGLIAVAGGLSAILLSASQPRAGILMLAGAASALLLALLDRMRHRLTPLALRAAADLVLLTPLVVMLR